MSRAFAFKVFNYTKDAESVVEDVDRLKPISLKYNEDLLDRVSDRYPFIPKYQIALIIRSTFYVMRTLLITNKILYLGSFIPTLYIRTAKRFTTSQGYYPLIKVKANTIVNVKKGK